MPGGKGELRSLTEEMVFTRTKCNRMDLIRNLNLWGNDLHDISILRHMPNLEVLSLSVNKVSSLLALRGCPKLTELYLRKNDIRDLVEVQNLATLRQLRVLWLTENPCAALPHYRQYVLHHLPGLAKLDSQDVTEEERRRATRSDVADAQTCAGAPPEVYGSEFAIDDSPMQGPGAWAFGAAGADPLRNQRGFGPAPGAAAWGGMRASVDLQPDSLARGYSAPCEMAYERQQGQHPQHPSLAEDDAFFERRDAPPLRLSGGGPRGPQDLPVALERRPSGGDISMNLGPSPSGACGGGGSGRTAQGAGGGVGERRSPNGRFHVEEALPSGTPRNDLSLERPPSAQFLEHPRPPAWCEELPPSRDRGERLGALAGGPGVEDRGEADDRNGCGAGERWPPEHPQGVWPEHRSNGDSPPRRAPSDASPFGVAGVRRSVGGESQDRQPGDACHDDGSLRRSSFGGLAGGGGGGGAIGAAPGTTPGIAWGDDGGAASTPAHALSAAGNLDRSVNRVASPPASLLAAAARGSPTSGGAVAASGPPTARADNILCAVLALVKELDQQGLELVRRAVEQRQAEL